MAIGSIQTAMRTGSQERAGGVQAALQGTTQAQQAALQSGALGAERQKTRANLAAVAYQEKQANRRTMARLMSDLTKFSIDEYLRWNQVGKENKAGASIIDKMSRLIDRMPPTLGTVDTEAPLDWGEWKQEFGELQDQFGAPNPFAGRARESSPYTSPY